jgi:hypothetical protein
MVRLDGFARDLRHGARLLRRNPAFTVVALTTLAVAIGASLTVFGIVDAWLFRPLNFPAADRLVVLQSHIVGCLHNPGPAFVHAGLKGRHERAASLPAAPLALDLAPQRSRAR